MAAVCVPFQLQVGLPYVFMAINGPNSEEAADAHAEALHPEWNTANQHSFIRFFVSLDDVSTANCNTNCAFTRPD